jgi:hypothetical protein
MCICIYNINNTSIHIYTFYEKAKICFIPHTLLCINCHVMLYVNSKILKNDKQNVSWQTHKIYANLM